MSNPLSTPPNDLLANKPAIFADWSHHQGQPNLAPFPHAGGVVKATEGISFTDPQLIYNASSFAQYPLIMRGPYHYFRAIFEAQVQADHFLNTTKMVADSFDIEWDYYAVDIESRNNVTPQGLPLPNFKRRALDLAEIIQAAVYPKKLLFYVGINVYENFMMSDPAMLVYPLWLSWPTRVFSYRDYPTRTPKGASGWSMWQYTWKGTVPGFERYGNPRAVDLNKFNGNVDEARDFFTVTRGSEPTIPPVPPTPPEPPVPPTDPDMSRFAAEVAEILSDDYDVVFNKKVGG